jgi:hypothetical protein
MRANLLACLKDPLGNIFKEEEKKKFNATLKGGIAYGFLAGHVGFGRS